MIRTWNRARWLPFGASAVLLLSGAVNAEVTLSINAPSAAPGETTVASVMVDLANGLAGADLAISFPDFISAGAAQTTPATADFLIASRSSAGRIEIAMARADGLTDQTAAILQIPMRVAKSAPLGTVALSVDQVRIYDAQPLAMPVRALAGSVDVAPPPPDLDNDGIPDSWETRYFGNSQGTAESDSDYDGLSDHQEFIAGTDPTAADSVFRIVNVLEVDDSGSRTLLVQWEAREGKSYAIQWSAGPIGPGMPWHAVYNPNIRKDGSLFSWTDDGTRTHGWSGTTGERFYRIAILPEPQE